MKNIFRMFTSDLASAKPRPDGADYEFQLINGLLQWRANPKHVWRKADGLDSGMVIEAMHEKLEKHWELVKVKEAAVYLLAQVSNLQGGTLGLLDAQDQLRNRLSEL